MTEKKNSPEPDSIYKAPGSDTSVAPSDDLMAAYVGPNNASYYAQRFAKIAAGGGAISWHWPAFFFTFFWMLYRKMWIWGLGYWLVLPICLSLIQKVLINVAGAAVAIGFYWFSYLFIGFVVAPVLANWLYYKHVKTKVAGLSGSSISAEQQAVELDRIGGTSRVVYVIAPVVLLVILGIISAIAIPAYQDYTIRAQVSEGLHLSGGVKAAVTARYAENRELPSDNFAAGLAAPEEISGIYVDSVHIDEGDIEIVYGNDAHYVISGDSIYLLPDVSNGKIEWICVSDTIENKHLPAACRS